MTLSPVADIAASIQARHLSTPLVNAMKVDLTQETESLASEMRLRQYDRVPVVDANDELIGLFSIAAEPVGSVSEGMCPVDSGMLVAGDASVALLIDKLRMTPFLFVVEGTSVSGFVTQADLKSNPARIYYYALLSQAEIAVADYLRGRFGLSQEGALEYLTPQTRNRIDQRIAFLVERDEFIDVISALSLENLLTIAKHDASFCEAVRAVGGTMGTKGITNFRDEVMHPARNSEFSVKNVARHSRNLTAYYSAATSLWRSI